MSSRQAGPLGADAQIAPAYDRSPLGALSESVAGIFQTRRR
jgi:hypothetical protein